MISDDGNFGKFEKLCRPFSGGGVRRGAFVTKLDDVTSCHVST